MGNPMLLAVDPGYASCGIVLGTFHPPFRIRAATAVKTNAEAGTTIKDVLARTEAVLRAIRVMAADAYAASESIAWGVTEAWEGGRHPSVTYRRGVSDGFVYCELSNTGNLPALVLPSAVAKAFLNPRGKAIDKGRKTDLEYRAALNMLDSVLSTECLRKIEKPKIEGTKTGVWKDGKQHTLDAGAIYAATCLAFWMKIDLDRVRGIGTQVQRDLAFRLAQDHMTG